MRVPEDNGDRFKRHYSRIGRRLDDLIGGDLTEKLKAYGCTNYMDMRIFMTLRRLMETSKLDVGALDELADLYEDFVSHVGADESYFLQGSGWYELRVPVEKARRLFADVRIAMPGAGPAV